MSSSHRQGVPQGQGEPLGRQGEARRRLVAAAAELRLAADQEASTRAEVRVAAEAERPEASALDLVVALELRDRGEAQVDA